VCPQRGKKEGLNGLKGKKKSHFRILVVPSAVFRLCIVSGHVILPYGPCREKLVLWRTRTIFPYKIKAHIQSNVKLFSNEDTFKALSDSATTT